MVKRTVLDTWLAVCALGASSTMVMAAGLDAAAAQSADSTGRAAASTQATAVPAPSSTAAAASGAELPDQAGAPAGPKVAPASRSQLPPGQVWQCVIDGQKVFSDSPCGEHASIRRLRDLNVMDAPAAPSYPYGYPYSPPYYARDTSAEAPQADEPDYDAGSPAVLLIRDRLRRDHGHHGSHARPRAQPPAHKN